MFPPKSWIHPATRATIPFRSLQAIKSTTESCVSGIEVSLGGQSDISVRREGPGRCLSAYDVADKVVRGGVGDLHLHKVSGHGKGRVPVERSLPWQARGGRV